MYLAYTCICQGSIWFPKKSSPSLPPPPPQKKILYHNLGSHPCPPSSRWMCLLPLLTSNWHISVVDGSVDWQIGPINMGPGPWVIHANSIWDCSQPKRRCICLHYDMWLWALYCLLVPAVHVVHPHTQLLLHTFVQNELEYQSCGTVQCLVLDFLNIPVTVECLEDCLDRSRESTDEVA